MRRFATVLVSALCLVAIGTGVQADPLKVSAKILETAPLVLTGEGPLVYEASLVNVGPNTALGFILLCDASTGVCTPAPGCPGLVLAPGHGCSANPGSGFEVSAWVRMVLIRFGDKKPIDARGALEVRLPGAIGVAIEATEAPTRSLQRGLPR